MVFNFQGVIIKGFTKSLLSIDVVLWLDKTRCQHKFSPLRSHSATVEELPLSGNRKPTPIQ